jgi:hypothetical protein
MIDRHQHADQPGLGDQQHGKQAARRDHAAAHAVQRHQESEQGGEQQKDQAQAVDRDMVAERVEALGQLQRRQVGLIRLVTTMHSSSSASAKTLPATTAVDRSLKAKTTARRSAATVAGSATRAGRPVRLQRISLKPPHHRITTKVAITAIIR